MNSARGFERMYDSLQRPAQIAAIAPPSEWPVNHSVRVLFTSACSSRGQRSSTSRLKPRCTQPTVSATAVARSRSARTSFQSCGSRAAAGDDGVVVVGEDVGLGAVAVVEANLRKADAIGQLPGFGPRQIRKVRELGEQQRPPQKLSDSIGPSSDE